MSFEHFVVLALVIMLLTEWVLVFLLVYLLVREQQRHQWLAEIDPRDKMSRRY
jgi:hypothetical protein